jgi:hypothetical protein
MRTNFDEVASGPQLAFDFERALSTNALQKKTEVLKGGREELGRSPRTIQGERDCTSPGTKIDKNFCRGERDKTLKSGAGREV